jgi:cephalosporin-C deacetylase-like acetyl esterase
MQQVGIYNFFIFDTYVSSLRYFDVTKLTMLHRYEVLRMVSLKFKVFLDTTPYRLVKTLDNRKEKAIRVFGILYLEDYGAKIIQNLKNGDPNAVQ